MKYKFRGRNVKTDKWEYGYLTSADTINDIRVRKNSIGMQSGVWDKHNKIIYENDIVKYLNQYYKVTYFPPYEFRLKAIDRNQSDLSLLKGIDNIEIVGDEEVYNDRSTNHDFVSRKDSIWDYIVFRT